MKIGMLWFDDDPTRPLSEKIERARRRFEEKYGYCANLVYLNPAMAGAAGVQIEGVEVKQAKSILVNHLWLGVAA